MLTADNLVSREVHYCVSSLVSTLASGYGRIDLRNSFSAQSDRDAAELYDLGQQAADLLAPLEDWESAAREYGWICDDIGIFHPNRDGNSTGDSVEYADTWQDACEISQLDPDTWDVFEHWIVSDWLADKLIAKGEKVDKDFAGLTVWARTTTGQGIAMDAVIQEIAKELVEGTK